MIARRVLLALVLMLSACGAGGGQRDPFTDSRIPPSLGPAYWPPQGWAWGLIQVGDNPPQRYGVGAPMDATPIAQVLLLPGYGGTAEEDFQDAGGLIDHRIQVWTLDGVGQGGSGRLTTPRDLGHVDSFDGDVAGLRQLVGPVIRPTADAPLVVAADGTAAPVLLRALQGGLPGVAAVVLTGPRLVAPSQTAPSPSPLSAPWARWLRYGRYRAPGATEWRRETTAAPGSAAFVRHAWQVANPDLRMGGPSFGWLAAFDELLATDRRAGSRSIQLPVLLLGDPTASAFERAEDANLCRALPHCTLVAAAPDEWPRRKIAFVLGVAVADENPLESAALPLPRRER